MAELKAIFTGKMTSRWKELGGADAEDHPRIRARTARARTCSSRSTCSSNADFTPRAQRHARYGGRGERRGRRRSSGSATAAPPTRRGSRCSRSRRPRPRRRSRLPRRRSRTEAIRCRGRCSSTYARKAVGGHQGVHRLGAVPPEGQGDRHEGGIFPTDNLVAGPNSRAISESCPQCCSAATSDESRRRHGKSATVIAHEQHGSSSRTSPICISVAARRTTRNGARLCDALLESDIE